MELKTEWIFQSVFFLNGYGLKEKRWDEAVTFAQKWPTTHSFKNG